MSETVVEALDTPGQIAAAILRSHHTARERTLDFLMAVLVLGLAFLWVRSYLGSAPPQNLVPNDDVKSISAPTIPRFYTSNFPVARSSLANNAGPTGLRNPNNPSDGPDYTSADNPSLSND